MADPILTFWNSTGDTQIYSIAFGRVEEGNETSPLGLRVYNNKAGASNIADAENVRFCAVDDHTISPPTYANLMISEGWLEARFTDYDDSEYVAETFSALGGPAGSLKHWFTANLGIIAGSSGGVETHFASGEIKIVLPVSTPRGDYNGSPVIEYTVS